MQTATINFCEHVKHANGHWKYVCLCKETEFQLLAIWMLFLFREGRTVPTVIQGGGRVVLLGCFASLDTRNLVQMHGNNEKKRSFWHLLEQSKGMCCQSVSQDISEVANFKVVSELSSLENQGRTSRFRFFLKIIEK